jgi:hypothetical protein
MPVEQLSIWTAPRHLGRRLATARSMLTGIFAGAIGGLVGTWAMSEAQRGWTRAVGGDVPESAAGKHDARDWQERHEPQNSNELAAQALTRHLIGRSLTREELPVAAAAMHYGFGAAVGALSALTQNGDDPKVPARHWGSACGLWPMKLRCRFSVSHHTPRLAGRSKCICSR